MIPREIIANVVKLVGLFWVIPVSKHFKLLGVLCLGDVGVFTGRRVFFGVDRVAPAYQLLLAAVRAFTFQCSVVRVPSVSKLNLTRTSRYLYYWIMVRRHYNGCIK